MRGQPTHSCEDESLTRLALGHVREGFLGLDDLGFCHEVNQSALQLLGQPESALLGQPYQAIFREESSQRLLRTLQEAYTLRTDHAFDHYFPGPQIWAEVRIIPQAGCVLVLLRPLDVQPDQKRSATSPPPAEPASRQEEESLDLQPWVTSYLQMLDQAVQQREYKVQNLTTEGLLILARELGQLGLGPRELIQIHRQAMYQRVTQLRPAQTVSFVEEGRLLLLELMGNLVTFYRNLAQ